MATSVEYQLVTKVITTKHQSHAKKHIHLFGIVKY